MSCSHRTHSQAGLCIGINFHICREGEAARAGGCTAQHCESRAAQEAVEPGSEKGESAGCPALQTSTGTGKGSVTFAQCLTRCGLVSLCCLVCWWEIGAANMSHPAVVVAVVPPSACKP